jgi:N-acetylmuramic acid 6-phosphate (MurNAc-6-P) etherase
MKILGILSGGYRATLEEQDDTIVWISHMLRKAGAELDLMLRGSAVNYVVEGQRVAPLAIGGRAQQHAPDVHGQVAGLAEAGARIFVCDGDLARYGLRDRPRLAATHIVSDDALAGLVSGYDRAWHW